MARSDLIRGAVTTMLIAAMAAACTNSGTSQSTPTAQDGTTTAVAPSSTPEPMTYPRGTRSGIPEVDAVLEAIERGDHQGLTERLAFREVACRVVIRDSGDLPACPEDVADGSLVSVFPESFCEGSYVHEGNEPEAFGGLDEAGLYAVYHDSELGSRGDYAIVLSAGGGVWWISDGRVVRISHGCGADVRTLVWSNGLSRVIVPPADSHGCGPADPTQRTFGDVNGDGLLDHVYLAGIDRIAIGACWAEARGEIAVGGMATTILRVFDAVGHDGAEIFYGDSTATSFIIQIAQVVDGELRRVMEGEDVLSFEISRQPASNGDIIGRGMECSDMDGDGTSELVEVSYVSTKGSVEWMRTPFELVDGVATRGTPTTGTLTVGVDEKAIDGLHSAMCRTTWLFSAAAPTP